MRLKQFAGDVCHLRARVTVTVVDQPGRSSLRITWFVFNNVSLQKSTEKRTDDCNNIMCKIRMKNKNKSLLDTDGERFISLCLIAVGFFAYYYSSSSIFSVPNYEAICILSYFPRWFQLRSNESPCTIFKSK